MFKRLLFAFLLLASFGLQAVESSGVRVTQIFNGTTAEIINPERSWYSWIGSQYCDGANATSISAARSSGYSLVLCILNLSAYRTNPTLGSDVIAAVNNAASLARSGGVKLVIRPAYNYDSNGCDATTAIVLQHVAQLKDVMRLNADVIAIAQVGMFGPYGEQWVGSCSLSRTDADFAALRDAALSTYHPRTYIAFRYPARVNTMFPSQLTAAQFATGSPQARTSIYNDCFWPNDGDGGTFTGLQDVKRVRLASDSNYIPYGGESCNSNESTARKGCANILSEGPYYHLSYLNRSYDQGYYNQWISEGCYAQVMRSMGYRIVLDSVSHQSVSQVGQTITAYVYMHNEGWARAFQPRRVVVRLRNNAGTVVSTGTSAFDLRLLPPQSTTQQQIPVSITTGTAGTLNLEICMPDRWASLANDVRYNVRPANANNPGTWNGTTGCFVTGTQVVVS